MYTLKVTIIPEDKYIAVGREGMTAAFVLHDPAIRVIQWAYGKGHIEYHDAPNKPLTEKDYGTAVALYVRVWTEARGTQEQERWPDTLAKAVEYKLAEVNNKYEQAITFLHEGYANSKVQLWPLQESKACALVQNPEAEAPFVRLLATAKNIPLQELVTDILKNAEAWLAPMAMLTATRQHLEHNIFEAKNIEDIMTIVVNYNT